MPVPASDSLSAADPSASGPAEPVCAADVEAVTTQLGRRPRGLVSVAHRCRCGAPTVVRTAPRLDDGAPFPTTFYLTCPRLASAIGTLEAGGLMAEMSQRLRTDPALAAGYRAAHEDYLRRRAELGDVPEIEGVSAGGMPERVKCLHVLVAHALAAGPGVNVLGDEALALLGDWTPSGRCADTSPEHPGLPPADSGPADSGPADSGPTDSGPADSGPADSGSGR